MSKDELVKTIKQIVGLARAGNTDESFQGYTLLFSNPEFLQCRPEDQRQALRLMVHSKVSGRPTPAMIGAFESAVLPLTELVSIYDEPADYEMLGMCHVMLGHEESASRMFRAGLAIERIRNPQSDLCGSLMRRIAEI